MVMKRNRPDVISDDEFMRAAECLKLMAHPARLRMADLLTREAMPVADLAAACRIPPCQACEHLRHMQRHGLLVAERRGRHVFYRADSPRIQHLVDCLRRNCSEKP